MVDKELIEIWRNMLKPAISSQLLETNYEGMGEQDKEEFERDLDEILDLALIGLKHKAQLPQEDTTKDATSSTSSTADTISRQFEEIVVSYPSVDLCNYPGYKGKPYFSILYKENGEGFIGYGTYNPEVLSRYLRDYFMLPAQPEERTAERTETHSRDLILRQAAIDAAELAYVRGMFPTPFIREVPPAQPEQRWIPCSERLPEDYKDVLITYTYLFELTCPQETAKLLKGAKTVSGNPIDPKVVWEVPFADYIAFYDVDEKRWFSPTDNPEPFPDEIKVIAWMPLPEPYKEEMTH